MELKKVDRDGGLWQVLIGQWEDEAAGYEVDLDDYAPASLGVLSELANQTPKKRSGVYALERDSTFQGMCQLNLAFLPGYDSEVLRVRHIIHSPRFDLDENVSVEDYALFLSQIFSGVLRASIDQMPAKHIKFHFRSPAERRYFTQLQEIIKDFEIFENVVMKGSWLYISKEAT